MKQKKVRPIKAWLARHKNWGNGYAFIFDKKPKADNGYFYGGIEMCSYLFERTTGIKLEPGEVRRVKRVVIKLEGGK